MQSPVSFLEEDQAQLRQRFFGCKSEQAVEHVPERYSWLSWLHNTDDCAG